MRNRIIAGFFILLVMMVVFAGCSGVKVPSLTNSCNETCGGKCLDSATQGCCGAKIYPLERVGCCNGTLYSLANQTCQNGGVKKIDRGAP